MRRNAKPRVIWDLDDTLNDLMRAWLCWPARPGAALAYGDLRENPPHRQLGLTEAGYKQSLDHFRNSDEAGRIQPLPEVLDWFVASGHGFEHHVLTARPLATVPAAAEWVFAHFGSWIRHFHFVPARRDGDNLPDLGEDKGAVIRRLGGADYFLDDDPKNLEAARDVVPHRLLVPQPWNDGAGDLTATLAVIARGN